MRIAKNLLALTAVVVLGLSACSSAKQSAGNPDITDIYWRLTELKGVPVPVATAGKKEVFIRLLKQGNRLEGFGGCNGFGGSFVMEDGGKISFSQIMGTMMACGDLEHENKLLDALRSTDNYIHTGKQLILNEGKKSPLARFEAIYYK